MLHPMAELWACPFCREMFSEGEASICPHCEIALRPLAELPPSHDAQLLDEPVDPVPPEDEPLPITFMGRGRGMLAVLAAFGIALFFAPWVHESAPEIRVWSGFEFAKNLPYIWAGGVSWFVMLPLVLSRRTIRQMRGARVAVGFLAGMVITTVLARLLVTPRSHPLVPVRYAWGWGLYSAGFVAVLALLLAWRFGGKLDDMPTQRVRRGDETLH